MPSEKSGLELGFVNNEEVFDEDDNVVIEKGNPIFSTVNIFPKSTLTELPFNITFGDYRAQVFEKAGKPTQTRQGEASFLGSAYLVDNYKVGDTVVSIDYEPKRESINFILIRDNNLVEHLKL
ncbi:hypothetical protein [Terrimonas pollutisoli]|uniref:hypothetical protein n=1 Tax=Terrimonas pollutisoli TaxID=3034147 RepID=UPI0023ED6F41|nr:hypothetical protein [Terrimonas sp. H1YJ31]